MSSLVENEFEKNRTYGDLLDLYNNMDNNITTPCSSYTNSSARKLLSTNKNLKDELVIALSAINNPIQLMKRSLISVPEIPKVAAECTPVAHTRMCVANSLVN